MKRRMSLAKRHHLEEEPPAVRHLRNALLSVLEPNPDGLTDEQKIEVLESVVANWIAHTGWLHPHAEGDVLDVTILLSGEIATDILEHGQP